MTQAVRLRKQTADLRQELDERNQTIAELQEQLEAERAKVCSLRACLRTVSDLIQNTSSLLVVGTHQQ